MANASDVDRAIRGKDNWNAWAAAQIAAGHTPAVDFSDTEIKGIDFGSFVFPGTVLFTGAKFTGAALFSGAKFRGPIRFRGAKFGDVADFENATFDTLADFRELEFSQAKFEGATFAGLVLFNGSKFVEAEFRRTAFASNNNVYFEDTRFSDYVTFKGAEFFGTLWFMGAKFLGSSDFEGTTFGSSIYFDHSEFSGNSRFDSAEFSGRINFHEVVFSGATHFDLARFSDGGSVHFSGAQFRGPAWFEGAKFLGVTDFETATFRSYVWFSGSVFGQTPDWRGTDFKTVPQLHSMAVGYAPRSKPWWRRLLREASSAESAARYRHLKKLATEGKDHERELAFFALELRAKRFHETTGFWPIALNVVYDWSSDFGRSIARPVLGIVGMVVATFILLMKDAYPGGTSDILSKAGPMFVIACTNPLLLIGSDKWEVRTKAFSALSWQDGFELLGQSVATLQSAFSVLLLFLAGLAVRNRFRIGGSGG